MAGTDAADWDGREWRNNEGMLGGAFVLKEGAARTCRIEGRDALMLEPGTVLEYCHSLLSPSKEHTLSGLVYRSGKCGVMRRSIVSLRE